MQCPHILMEGLHIHIHKYMYQIVANHFWSHCYEPHVPSSLQVSEVWHSSKKHNKNIRMLCFAQCITYGLVHAFSERAVGILPWNLNTILVFPCCGNDRCVMKQNGWLWMKTSWRYVVQTRCKIKNAFQWNRGDSIFCVLKILLPKVDSVILPNVGWVCIMSNGE